MFNTKRIKALEEKIVSLSRENIMLNDKIVRVEKNVSDIRELLTFGGTDREFTHFHLVVKVLELLVKTLGYEIKNEMVIDESVIPPLPKYIPKTTLVKTSHNKDCKPKK